MTMPSPPSALVVHLLSDSTFGASGRGEGIDRGVAHDERTGLPVIPGRTLRGLLRESWRSMAAVFPELDEAADRLFGRAGDTGEGAILRLDDGQLDRDTRAWARYAVEREGGPTPRELLDSLTAPRGRLVDDRDASGEASVARLDLVVLRGLRVEAALSWSAAPDASTLRCLALAALATRHGGAGRTRGRGLLSCYLAPDPATTRALAGLGGSG